MHYFLLAVLILCTFKHGEAYFITVDAHAEECFFDKVEIGTKLGKYYFVFEFVVSLILK